MAKVVINTNWDIIYTLKKNRKIKRTMLIRGNGESRFIRRTTNIWAGGGEAYGLKKLRDSLKTVILHRKIFLAKGLYKKLKLKLTNKKKHFMVTEIKTKLRRPVGWGIVDKLGDDTPVMQKLTRIFNIKMFLK